MRKRTTRERRLSFQTLERRTLLAADVTTNLVGHWSFNEGSGSTTADLAGGDDPGTLIGNPTWTNAGKVHGALVFNGSSTSVSIAESTGLHVGNDNITIAAWIKTTASNGTAMSKGLLTGDHIALQVTGGKARFQFNPGGGPFGVTGATAVNDGNWHLLVGVRTSAQSCAVYVDGVLDGTLNSTGAFTSVDSTAPLLIGTAGAGTYFSGTIDDVRFFDRDLAAADIAALFALGSHPITVDDRYVVSSIANTIAATNGVLVNDVPRDQTALTSSLITNAIHGSVSLNSDGSFSYTPQNGYTGTDRFTYRTADDAADPTGATVSLTVYSATEWANIGSRVTARAMLNASSISASSVNSITNKMNPDGSFNDLTYVSNTAAGAAALNSHASRLSTMSEAYQAVGGPKYLDATLKQRIIDGYTYLAYSAPNTLSLPNWYDTKIGVPNNLWPGLVAMRNDLSSALLTDLEVKFFDLATVWDLSDLSEKNAGANLADRARATLAVAVLKNDPTLLPEIVSNLTRDLNSGGVQAAGLMPDNSFSQHTTYPSGSAYQGGVHAGDSIQLYAGSYGVVYAQDISDILPWVHGTTFAFSGASESAAVGYVLDGQAWLFRNKAIEPTSTGRAITRKGETIVVDPNAMSGAATQLISLGLRANELQSFVDRLSTGTSGSNYLAGNKAFFTTDTMVQQRQGYMASVRMISQRTLRPETLQIPGGTTPEGGKNFFLADGVTTIYQDGTEYGSTSGQEIFPAWNWSILPGTTLEQLSDAQVMSLSTSTVGNDAANIGTGTFVGSVSNGTYGAAAMDYGRTLGSVTAKKAYFYFDEGFVALGAGINAPAATNLVYTTLNQALQNGTVTIKAANGSVQSFGTGTTQTVTNPQWVLHAGVGYAMLGNNGTLTVQAQPQTGTWDSIGTATGSVTQNVFSAWVDHGVAPQNAGYAYAVLPGVNAASLDGYLAASPLSVLSNTASLQAVRNNSSKVTQIAFYQPGSITVSSGLTITVNQACMVQVRELAGKDLELAISDPTQSRSQITATVTRHLSGSNVSWQASTGLSTMNFSMPGGVNNINAGQSVVANLPYIEDLPVVSFAQASQVTPGESGTYQILATLTPPASGPMTASLTVPVTLGGSAAELTDFTLSGKSFIFPVGATSAAITLSVVSDQVIEADESVILNLNVPEGVALAGSQTTHTLTIVDDDSQPVSFAAATQSVSESAGLISAMVTLGAPSNYDITIPFSLSGSAGGGDYNSLTNSPLVILAGQTSASINLMLIDDRRDELNETIQITLGTPTNGILGTTTSHVITILDNDPTPLVQFASLGQIVSETTTTANVIVRLSAVSDLDVSIPFTISGTADNADATVLTTSPLLIPAGQSTASIDISIIDDILSESTESLILNMGSPTNGVRGAINTYALSIVDNESPVTVQFATGSFNVNEAAGSVPLIVSLSSIALSDVVVPFTFGGSADSNDFTSNSTTVTIPAGQTRAIYTVTINDDTLDELAETMSIAIGTPSGAVRGANSSINLTIDDNDPALGMLRGSDRSVDENGTITVYAKSLSPVTADLSVPFTVFGTATNGADYTLSSNQFQFLAGASTAAISITIVDDVAVESSEWVTLQLQPPATASLASSGFYTLYITDNDAAAAPGLDLNGLDAGQDFTNPAGEYVEDTAAVTLMPNATVVPPGAQSLTLIVVFLESAANGTAEQLTATGSGGATATAYNPTSRSLTITGGTASDMQAVLRSVAYQNTSQNPTAGGRFVSVTANFSASTESHRRKFNVTPVDDAPVVVTSGGSTTYVTGNVAVAVDASIGLSDIENNRIVQATATLIDAESGDTLSFAPTAGFVASVAGNSVTINAAAGFANLTAFRLALSHVFFATTTVGDGVRSVTFSVTDTSGVSGVAGATSSTVSKNIAIQSPLLIADVPINHAGSANLLTLDQVQPLVTEAIARWESAGASALQLAALSSTTIVVRNLEDDRTLGLGGGSVIVLDDNAAGRGWFVDTTPSSDREFTTIVASSESLATTGPAADGVDLLTVLMHEFGHVLGLDDLAPDHMTHSLFSDSLGVGIRRSLSPAEIEVYFTTLGS